MLVFGGVLHGPLAEYVLVFCGVHLAERARPQDISDGTQPYPHSTAHNGTETNRSQECQQRCCHDKVTLLGGGNDPI